MVAPLGLGIAHAGDCRQKALDQLRDASPGGSAIYRQTSREDFFASWIDCRDPQFDLSTAVHEATHFITGETDAFPLVGGGAIARPHEASAFFAPSHIANQFEDDDFAAIYLRGGKASSATDFLYLLDELNAYSHDLETAVDLKHLSAADQAVDHRDGLAALMAFVAVYVETARASDSETWSGLRAPRVAKTIAALWGRAERVMTSSCGIPNFGTVDTSYIRRFCEQRTRAALEPILGRSPVCPSACPEPPRDGEPVAEESLDASPLRLAGEAARPHHPFGMQRGVRRHRLRARAD